MSENSIDKDELIRQLLTDRDRLFRENSRLRAAVNADPGSGKQNYQEQLATKDSIINKKEALLEEKNVRIAQLEKQVAYLSRQLYGGKAERYINPNPEARQLDLFEGTCLLPGEKEAAIKAEQDKRRERGKR